MKCEKIESLLFLYTELTEDEKLRVDKHVQSCASCNSLFIRLTHQQQLIRQVAETPVLVGNSTRIKNSVMQAIVVSNKNWFQEFFETVKEFWLRTSMAFASILLVGFFFAELSTEYSCTKFNSTYSALSNVHLNTANFLKAHVDRRESTNQVSVYECLKQHDCEFLKNLKNKRNYEEL